MNSPRPPQVGRQEDPWALATEQATQFVAQGSQKTDTRAPADQTIGKAVGGNTWELFVSCLPADALAQQFDIRSPIFMTLHDLGGDPSRRFLVEVAHRLKLPVKRLVIRRQGFGTELATLYFFDLQATDGQVIRIYSTDTRTDEISGNQLRKVLLSRSQMNVVVVGAMPATALDSSMTALAQNLQEGRKGACTLVFVPMASWPTLPAVMAGLSRRTGVQAFCAAPVQRPIDAWPFLVAAWNRQHAGPRPSAKPESLTLIRTETEAAGPATPSPVQSEPGTRVEPKALSPDQLHHLSTYAQGVGAFKGVVTCCIFNVVTLALQAQAGGTEPRGELMVRQGRLLVASMQAASQAMGLGKTVREGVIQLNEHLILLRLVRSAPNMLLMVIARLGNEAELLSLKAEVTRHERAFRASIAAV